MNSNQYRLIQNNCEALPRCSCVPSAQQQPVGAHINSALLFFSILLFIVSCQSPAKKDQPVLFETLQHDKTGLDFNNKLYPDSSFNVLDYMYFYNGAGVAASDFNNDGRIDLFFAANQSNNSLYLNEGNLHFKNVTVAAKIPQDGGWSTGVAVVDINNDGLNDIYVCRVGNYMKLQSRNQLLICKGLDRNGVPIYEDEAKDYGLDFSGFSTQAAFLDYDHDGDIDMFLLNHSVHQNGTFAERKNFVGTYHPLSGDKFFRNDGNRHFTDVTKQTGINSSAIGYGLGIVVADINLDGWPDIYIGNDFHENDYLYINQHNGTFKEDMTNEMMHTSEFSMGVDAADINNDALPDIVSADMLPSDPYMIKRSMGEDKIDVFNMKIKYGYSYQYSRNNLQLNRGNGVFSEVGLYSGMFATDWSWSTLWMDFDNDGWKDLFISNGIPKRLTDIDYINYISNEEIQAKLQDRSMSEKDMALIDNFPEIKLPNAFYKNNRDASFIDVGSNVAGNINTFSNGAVYADLDNDGDLDIVTSDISDPVLLYKNTSNDKARNSYLQVKLKGPVENGNAVGSKVIVYSSNSVSTYEKFPVHGFMSSIETPLHIGLQNVKADSMLLVWPDGSYQPLPFTTDTLIEVSYRKNLPLFNYAALRSHLTAHTKPMEDITALTGLFYKHQENDFNEFNREALIPQMLSEEGPALAVADINKDGLEDVFLGASKHMKSAIFLQNTLGKFERTAEPSLDNDSIYEDVSACFADIDNDGNTDLVVASGGNEYFGQDEYMQPRLYLNNGSGVLTKADHAFDSIWLTASVAVPYDFNGDGFVDLFIGARSVPWEYGKIPGSYLLQNDGKGHFKDVTSTYAKELGNAGFVTDAQWFDIDKDGDKDLLLALQWGPITMFINDKGHFTKEVIGQQSGWWNFITPVDLDNDGDYDFVAGNLGLNNRLKASDAEPLRMYYNDFDDNGKNEQVLTSYVQGKELVFASKDELQRQMPFIKKKYFYADDFAKASISDIFPKDKLSNAAVFKANYLANAIFINKGNMQFEVQAMPWQAQLSSLRTAMVVDANNDSLPDILLGGNFYANNIEMGRSDADFGTVLLNKGNDLFEASAINGLTIKGQSRHIAPVRIGKQQAYIVARNGDSAMIIKYAKK
ncbi:MAG TPA: VCBS repeat-containing protein [Panacibacter sp.]|nr:VCBS repeat-containing protein [Panacibacter sp.]HNP43850.1 VCBS repeat-containing protein [Panacibacter sp.]